MSAAQLGLFAPAGMVPTAVKEKARVEKDELRPYQREAVEATLRELERVRSTLVVAHTGAGKTQIGGALAKTFKGRVLWLAHRDFLIDQAVRRLQQMTGEWPAIEKAQSHADGSRIVVGSVQTMRGARLTTWKPDWFDLIIYDEAHHAVAPGGRAILDHFSRAKVFGITATPRRHDKIGQWNVFDSEAYRRDIDVGIADGYFVPIVPVARFVDSIDISKVKTTAGDLNLGDLEKEIANSAAPIALATFEEMGDRQTIVYTPGRASAHAVADTLNQIKPGSAVSVDMDTEDRDRVRILSDFATGKIQYICNCAIFTEGLDVPHARGIVIARPTKSEGLYVQMSGRGGRPEPGIGELPTREMRLAAIAASSKPNFLLLDITGEAGRHSLVNVSNALAGKAIRDDVKERAAELAKSNKSKSLDDLFKQAADELDAEKKKRREAVARAAAAAEIRARRSSFDPFRRFGVDERPRGINPTWAKEPPTEDDIAWLKKNRLPTKKATRATVEALRAQARQWYAKGMANFRQRDLLSRYSCPVDVSFIQASRLLDAMAKNARGGQYYGRLTQAQIDSVMMRERQPGEEG